MRSLFDYQFIEPCDNQILQDHLQILVHAVHFAFQREFHAIVEGQQPEQVQAFFFFPACGLLPPLLFSVLLFHALDACDRPLEPCVPLASLLFLPGFDIPIPLVPYQLHEIP